VKAAAPHALALTGVEGVSAMQDRESGRSESLVVEAMEDATPTRKPLVVPEPSGDLDMIPAALRTARALSSGLAGAAFCAFCAFCFALLLLSSWDVLKASRRRLWVAASRGVLALCAVATAWDAAVAGAAVSPAGASACCHAAACTTIAHMCSVRRLPHATVSLLRSAVCSSGTRTRWSCRRRCWRPLRSAASRPAI
jgi:hypothetical protein